jgi:hypothetical protein
MKTILFIFFVCISIPLFSQTNVSGGIYTNTTWTAANSPYIVTDTVVVFPGVTLTIDPGVTVKFDDGLFIEIRNAGIIANGTSTDSVIFTSNSAAPVTGIWGGGNAGIWINGPAIACTFNFCKVEYATTGINGVFALKNSLFQYNNVGVSSLTVNIDSCIFNYNVAAINDCDGDLNFCTVTNNTVAFNEVIGSMMTNCRIDSNGKVTDEWEEGKIYYSSVCYNTFGIRTHINGGGVFDHCQINYNTDYGLLFTADGDSVRNCELKYNGTGINLAGHVGYGGNHVSDCDIMYNNIGIESSSNYTIQSLITRCDISYNAVGVKVSYGNFDLSCNRICNNTSYGLQMNTSSPYNATHNYWCTSDSLSTSAIIYDGYDNVTYGLCTFWPADTTSCNVPTGIAEAETINPILFPNPTSGNFSISNTDPSIKEIWIYNTLGEIVFIHITSGKDFEEINSNLKAGIYFVVLQGVIGRKEIKLLVE